MRLIIYSLVFVLLFSFKYLDDIYKITLRTIDGKRVDLASFKGKKMLFIICPTSSTDTVITTQELIELQTRYENNLAVIGIVSEEAGYKGTDGLKVKNMYKNQRPNFILAEGMRVKKSARSNQAELFQWLTNKTKNRHFDLDVEGVGQKYFVDENGELYAVLGPQVKLSSEIIHKILNRKARGKILETPRTMVDSTRISN